MMRITHAVTDNDGVNLDNSEEIAMRVMDDEGSHLVLRYNANAALEKDHIYKTYAGTSTNKIVEILIEKYDLPLAKIAVDYGLSPTASLQEVGLHIAHLITLETNRRFKFDGLRVPLGTVESWAETRDMLGADNIALATTSREDRMLVSLAVAVDPKSGIEAGLNSFFPEGDRCISGYGYDNKYDYAFPKLARYGFTEENSVIIEDSKSGVNKARYRADKSARPSAVIGTVASSYYPDKDGQAKLLLAEGADIVISHMGDLAKAIRWLNDGLDLAQKPDFIGTIYLPSATSMRPQVKPAVSSTPSP